MINLRMVKKMNFRKNDKSENDIIITQNIYNSNEEFLVNHIGYPCVDIDFIKNEIEEMENHGFLSNLIYDNDKAIGILDYKIQEDKTVYLSLLMLDSKLQDRGLGKNIYQTFERQLVEANCKSIRLDVVNDHEPNAIGFWEKMGFVEKRKDSLTWGSKTSNVVVMEKNINKAYFHLPGLFEFYDLYKAFIPLFREHREYFYEWCEIGSIYGAPADCIWGGGRVGFGEEDPNDVASLLKEYGISARLTFSNSLIRKEHLQDKKCNKLCKIFSSNSSVLNGVILTSDLLLNYIKEKYKDFYFVSSTTKVLREFSEFENELNRAEVNYVVPDFRLNKDFEKLKLLTNEQKNKVEFLCNECCSFGCMDRKKCYENVSRKSLGEDMEDHICQSPNAQNGYRFSDAMKNPGFIGVEDIKEVYLPNGFSNYKIEGRSLGSAIVLEFLLYYMTKPEYQLHVREAIYLDSMLDLF